MMVYSHLKYLGKTIVFFSFFVIKSPQSPHLIHPNFFHLEIVSMFKTEVKQLWAAQCAKSRALINVLR